MKSFSVVAEAPATAYWVVEAESRSDAIRLVKDRIAAGQTVDFEISIQDMDDPGDVEFYAIELGDDENDSEDGSPALTKYSVVLTGVVQKEVPVNATSPHAALEMVKQMCSSTGLLNFHRDDVTGLTAAVEESKADPVTELLLDMVRHIRSSDAPDMVLARSLQAGLDESISIGMKP